MGVLGVRPEEGECLTAGQKDLLESMGAQLAMALEREELRAERARTRLMEESEKLHRSLLDSVSHEFKTPLAVIEGGCEKLAGRAVSAPEEREEYGEILLAARRLRRLVKNLLDVSRLESGALKPKLDCYQGSTPESSRVCFPAAGLSAGEGGFFPDGTGTGQSAVECLRTYS